MSLETVIKIGHVFRHSKEGLNRHRYINQSKKDIDRWEKTKTSLSSSMSPVIYQLPVVELETELIFDWQNLSKISDEDKIKSLQYLNFKTSDRDSTKKYLFGDIVYAHYKVKKEDEKQKEEGNYQLSSDKKVSSFFRGDEVSNNLKGTFIGKFRDSFRKDILKIEALLEQNEAVVIHFAFENQQNWFEVEDALNLVNKKLMEEFVAEDKATKKISLQKALFKTISGGAKSDAVGGVMPNFNDANNYKVKAFDSVEQVIDLLYGIGISEYIKIRVAKDLGLVVLPNGDNLDANSLTRFYSRVNNLDLEVTAEEDIAEENIIDNDSDLLFNDLVENDFDDTIKFDIIFTKPPAGSSPSIDLLEISSIQKSLLKEVNSKVNSIKSNLKSQFLTEYPRAKKPLLLDIKFSFLKILSDKTKAEKKYHFHLLKVLPQIYSDAYYNDPIIFPAFIEKVERNIRNDEQGYNLLKYDFYFLMNLQKIDNLMAITNTKSYALGTYLGTMADPFAAWRTDCPIKSFEKHYVGNLTRRITDLNDIMKFSVFLNEKLTIHEKMYLDKKIAYQNLIQAIGNFDEKYDKNACALGFFASYFTIKNDKQPLNNQENESIN
jgi:hypothetical protein